MPPDWITRERRVHPPVEEQIGLVEHQIMQMATQIEINRRLSEKNNDDLEEVCRRLDTVIAHVEEHRVATAELIEVFTFSKMLRRFVAWVAGGVLLLFAFFKDGSDFLGLFK
jgi:hypothetical protein